MNKLIVMVWALLGSVSVVQAQEIAPGPDMGNPWDEPIKLEPLPVATAEEIWAIHLSGISKDLFAGKPVRVCIQGLGECSLVSLTRDGATIQSNDPLDKRRPDMPDLEVYSLGASSLAFYQKNGLKTLVVSQEEAIRTLEEVEADMAKIEQEILKEEDSMKDRAAACLFGAVSCGYDVWKLTITVKTFAACGSCVWAYSRGLEIVRRVTEKKLRLARLYREKVALWGPHNYLGPDEKTFQQWKAANAYNARNLFVTPENSFKPCTDTKLISVSKNPDGTLAYHYQPDC